MDERPVVRFQPTRPASRTQVVAAFVLGGMFWTAAGVIAVVLLGGTYIVRYLLVVTAVSWLVFGATLAVGIALRQREVHRVPD
ncbi:hypothetical protein [Streptomyces sp. LN245]|uniref:hypothetical protein n=1 Tax=Streptomyces sp. LN245 TaxID=3112975 RepID=UPI00371CB1EE